MQSILAGISPLSATAVAALFSAVWEGTALALCVHLALRLFPRLSPAARSVIWLNLFVLMALLHFVPAIVGSAPSSSAAPVPALHLDPRWSLALAGCWLMMSLWRAFQLVHSAWELRRLVRKATPLAVDSAVQAVLDQAAAPRRAQLCVSADVARPSVLGFFHPRVLLPPSLAEELTSQELQQVLIHEMEHLRRIDDWTNLLQKIGLVLFPLNPALYWVEQRLCTERELACDDRVLRVGQGRKAYALCLTHLAEHNLLRRGYNLALGAWERRPELVRRVQRILAQPMRSMGRKPAFIATGSLIAGSLGCALALARAPQLVTFFPTDTVAQVSQPVLPAEARQLRNTFGAPQLVKAVMPMPQKTLEKQQKTARKRVKSAVFHPRHRVQPIQNQRTTVMLTQFNDLDMTPRLILTFSQTETPAPVVVPAFYTVVRTPNGWLILQI